MPVALSLLITFGLLEGCSANRMNETAEKLDASRETLRTCLATNQSKPKACAAQREMFQADLDTYNACAAAINGAHRGTYSYYGGHGDDGGATAARESGSC